MRQDEVILRFPPEQREIVFHIPGSLNGIMQREEPVLQRGHPVQDDVHRVFPAGLGRLIPHAPHIQRRGPFHQDGVRAETGEVLRHHIAVLQEHPRTILDVRDPTRIHHLAAALLIQPDEPHPVPGTHRSDGEIVAHPLLRIAVAIVPVRGKEIVIASLRATRKQPKDADNHRRPTYISHVILSHTTNKSSHLQFLHESMQ